MWEIWRIVIFINHYILYIRGLNDNENKKHFTLIKAPSMLNIKNINSGGHHSWIIIDEEHPERIDYEDPTPLSSPNFTPNNMRSIENSPKTKLNVSMSINNNNNISKQTGTVRLPITNRPPTNTNLKFNLEYLTEKIDKATNKKNLQVVYTDLKKCHRFVRFFVNKNKNINYKDLNNMMADYFKYDKSVVLFRLQADDEINLIEEGEQMTRMNMIFREIKSDFKVLDLNSSGKLSYSLTIIYDLEKNNKMSSLRKNIEDLKLKNNVMNTLKNRSICNNSII
jgi:hypothetical protein